MTHDMTPEAAAALRRPFGPESVGILPKPMTRNAQKGKCRECGGYHGLPAVHLDYVGHAAVTDRLLAVDPAWTWEPVAVDANGLPALDAFGNLWIKLTVCGVTRLGVGDGRNAKELIGDAIRNAAMRFGVALDLWSKEELEGAGDDPVYKATAAATDPAEPEPAADLRAVVLDTLAATDTPAAVGELYRQYDIANAPDDIKDAFRERVADLEATAPAGGDA